MEKMTNAQKFCNLIRNRSYENRESIELLIKSNLFGNCISILRQELDSMVRVIYLIAQDEIKRDKLICKTLNGQKWNVTDREMVDLASKTYGWTRSVYKFGCSFIHLSQFHGYTSDNPFDLLKNEEVKSIRFHLNQYHGFPMEVPLTIDTISPYLSKVFEKISGNLGCYLEHLSDNPKIEDLI